MALAFATPQRPVLLADRDSEKLHPGSLMFTGCLVDLAETLQHQVAYSETSARTRQNYLQESALVARLPGLFSIQAHSNDESQ